MKYHPTHHHRRSIRLRGYDYSTPGVYFVTICVKNRECLFGDVVDGQMQVNEWGKIVWACWDDIPCHFRDVQMDAFVVMPNHVHGIIVISDVRNGFVGAQHAAPLHPDDGSIPYVVSGSLGAIVRSFKSAVTKRINALRGTRGVPLWQRNYYERIIRHVDELHHIREYIAMNPTQWADDENHPSVRAQHAAPVR